MRIFTAATVGMLVAACQLARQQAARSTSRVNRDYDEARLTDDARNACLLRSAAELHEALGVGLPPGKPARVSCPPHKE